MDNEILTIHTDGGSRGNPGPAASAFVVTKKDDKIYEDSKYLGQKTNNYAEYYGVIIALQWLGKNIDKNVTRIDFVLDSELIVKQINGLYKVKDRQLYELFSQVKKLLQETSVVTSFKNVPRKENIEADALVNKCLDKNVLDSGNVQ